MNENLTSDISLDRSVDLGGLRITAAAQLLKGATISSDQAADLLREIGIRVM